MNVVHISTFSGIFGAGIAAARIHKMMLNAGINSKIITLESNLGVSAETDQLFFPHKNKTILKIKKNLFALGDHLVQRKKLMNESFGWSVAGRGFSVEKMKEIQNADIIFLHWINSGFLSIDSVARILKTGKPVYWILHDMWEFTGGCHYSFDCDRYTDRCQNCPFLIPERNGLANKVFEKKMKKWSEFNNLHIIAPSSWMGQCAKKSRLFKNLDIHIIHNPLDLNLFKPLDKENARDLFNFPRRKKLLLFGAIGGTGNPYKGWTYLVQALKRVRPTDIELVVLGSGRCEEFAKDADYPVHYAGWLQDEYSICMLYNAVDAFVTPSLADNWPSTIIEAHACGIPVVGFAVGGIPEMIHHGKDGYLARYQDSADLAAGISCVLSRKWNAYDIAADVKNFANEKIIMQKHLEIWGR